MDINIYQRERKRNDLVRKLKILGYSIGLVLFAAWGFFWLPWLRISDIKTDDYVSKGEVENAISPYLASANSFWLPNDNYFLLQAHKLENILKEKDIGLAAVKKNFPKTIDIKFPQNEPWLIYCSEVECFYVSDKGLLFDRAPKFSQNPLPEIIMENKNGKIGDRVASPAQALFLRNIFHQLNLMNIDILSASFGAKAEVKFITGEKWYLKIINNDNAQKTLGDLKLLLDEKIKGDRTKLEYIDMRYENKAYYKLR